MMHNADQVMAAEGVTVEQIAFLLDLPLETAESRIYGDDSFTVSEAFLLKDALFPHHTLDALFGASGASSV